jgi:hypothetical protein
LRSAVRVVPFVPFISGLALSAITALLAPACSVYLDESLLSQQDADSGTATPAAHFDAAPALDASDAGVVTDAGAPVEDASATIDAAMSVGSLDPSSVTLGAGNTPLRVIGSGFVSGDVVRFNGVDLVTAFASATELKATIPSSALAAAGTYSVVVVGPSAEQSSSLSFSVENPAPVLASVSPAQLKALASDTTITLTGAFIPVSVVQADAAPLVTTYVSPTQITAIVPQARLAVPGSIAITVVNGTPGGGTSAPIGVDVVCSASGVDVAFTATGKVESRATNLTTSMRSFNDGSTCPATLYPNVSEATRGWVVQNQTAASVVLSAWAVCSSSSDAYLTFYRRSTVPATNTDLLACTPTIAEGVNGAGGYTSPESNGSSWCPGLTKANGQGLTLGVCEKAVVLMQEYNPGSGPGTLKMQID